MYASASIGIVFMRNLDSIAGISFNLKNRKYHHYYYVIILHNYKGYNDFFFMVSSSDEHDIMHNDVMK